MDSMLAKFKSSGFDLWKYLKSLVYAAPVDNEEALHRIVVACQTIRNYPRYFGADAAVHDETCRGVH
jgi:hypothetical protein